MNPSHWKNPHEFQPSRFSDASNIVPYSFMPWISGPRQCIGREFALLTARVGLFTLLNKYMPDMSPKSNVEIQEAIFIFASGLLMNFTARPPEFLPAPPLRNEQSRNEHSAPTNALHHSSSSHGVLNSAASSPSPLGGENEEKLEDVAWRSDYDFHIVAGSNNIGGNAYSIAQRSMQNLLRFHFKLPNSVEIPNGLIPLLEGGSGSGGGGDAHTFTIILFVLSTYQGKPSQSTKNLLQWIQKNVNANANGSGNGNEQRVASMKNIHYCVFGCGNSNWTSTYQQVPKFVDASLEKLGATRFLPLETFNEARDDLDEVFTRFFEKLSRALFAILPRNDHAAALGDMNANNNNLLPNAFIRGLSNSDVMKVRKSVMVLRSTLPHSAVRFSYVGDAKSGSEWIYFPSLHVEGKQVFQCPVKVIRNITPSKH